MNCTPEYIANKNLSKSETDRLSDIHNSILHEAKLSKAFKPFRQKYYTLKQDYAKGLNFVAEINKKYNTIVAKLIKIPTGQSYLSVNTLPLQSGIQSSLNLDNKEYTPEDNVEEKLITSKELPDESFLEKQYFLDFNSEVTDEDIQEFKKRCK